jgi:two-component system, OmpR family, sensor histidine kinase KdpD
MSFSARKKSKIFQHTTSVLIILAAASICFVLREVLGYRVVAMVLLMTLSIIAILFDIFPVLLSAIYSAIILNYFFIPPYYTLHISDTEDILLFLMFLFVALVNAVLSFKIIREEKKTRDKEEKENSIKLYNTLFNSLSHELRTPISTIIGAVDALKENKEKLSIETQNELLSEIDNATIRLNRQVENLLNMSRLETGLLRLKPDWHDINELIYNLIQKMEPFPKNHTILFDPDERLPLCKIDGGITEQILQNLIYNALQYTPIHSTIHIVTRINSSALQIEISDNGNGIPEEYYEEIFNKFYRLPNSKTGGTGLGLSIVKGYIDILKGSIQIEKSVPHGAKFTINIPVETSYINNLKNE